MPTKQDETTVETPAKPKAVKRPAAKKAEPKGRHFAIAQPNYVLGIPGEENVRYVNVNYGSPVITVEDPAVIEALLRGVHAREVEEAFDKSNLKMIVKPDGSVVREAYDLAYQAAI